MAANTAMCLQSEQGCWEQMLLFFPLDFVSVFLWILFMISMNLKMTCLMPKK